MPESPEETHVHGVLLQVESCGILITGPAGCGKSQLGLELLSRGHRFVADDSVVVRRQNEQLIGEGLELCSEFLALRCGLVVNVQRQFGPESRLDATPIHLVVSPGPALQAFADPPQRQYLGLALPHYYLQNLPGSAVCLEALAWAWQAQQNGYSAAADLATRQAQSLQAPSSS